MLMGDRLVLDRLFKGLDSRQLVPIRVYPTQ
jgi:hypothetical protein